jgi:propanol-preferring alcohol dehydrogenase
MLVPHARQLVPLPDGLDPVAAAPLTDAGLTPYHAVRRSWPKLPPGSVAVVIGVGGLGHLAVQILRATTSARIVAVDTREEARALALNEGAELAVAPDDTAVAVIRDATGGRGADVVLDFVGADTTIALGAAVSRFLGDLTVVGIAGGTFPFTFFSLPYEVSVQTTYWGSRPELVEVLDLAARGLLRPAVTAFPLEEAVQAYHLMESGSVLGRQVIVPTAAG